MTGTPLNQADRDRLSWLESGGNPGALLAEDEYYCDDCGHVGPGRRERSGLVGCTRCRSVLLCQECGGPAEDNHICEY